jgi:hypothetical protein
LGVLSYGLAFALSAQGHGTAEPVEGIALSVVALTRPVSTLLIPLASGSAFMSGLATFVVGPAIQMTFLALLLALLIRVWRNVRHRQAAT